MAKTRTNELLNALKSPQRRAILREVEKSRDGISPSELAVKVKEPLSNAAYNCRVLRDCGAIELVDQQQVRGAIKNLYRFALADSWAIAMLRHDKGSDENAPDLDP